jgi:hypothetical protein
VGELALLQLWFVWLANVPIVGWQNFNFFCAVGKKLNHEAVGCNVGKSLPDGRYLFLYF